MPKKKVVEEPVAPTPEITTPVQALADAIASATTKAIEAARPQKKTVANFTPRTPYDPPEGTPRSKLKRKMYQHSLQIKPEFMTNQEIDLLNKLRPGKFCDNWVTVTRRRDKGVDITYPIKTPAQRLALVHRFGIRNFTELLERCIYEAEHPKSPDEDFDVDFG